MHLPTFPWGLLLPGVLATCSVEIFGHYTVESPHSQISLFQAPLGKCQVLLPLMKGELQQHPNQAQLNKCMTILSLCTGSVFNSVEHSALGMRSAFPKDSSDVMTNKPQKYRGVNLWGNRWPMRNRRWEGADSPVPPPSHPQLLQCARMDVPCGLPGHVPG